MKWALGNFPGGGPATLPGSVTMIEGVALQRMQAEKPYPPETLTRDAALINPMPANLA
jgi:hypothetical protein